MGFCSWKLTQSWPSPCIRHCSSLFILHTAAYTGRFCQNVRLWHSFAWNVSASGSLQFLFPLAGSLLLQRPVWLIPHLLTSLLKYHVSEVLPGLKTEPPNILNIYFFNVAHNTMEPTTCFAYVLCLVCLPLLARKLYEDGHFCLFCSLPYPRYLE